MVCVLCCTFSISVGLFVDRTAGNGSGLLECSAQWHHEQCIECRWLQLECSNACARVRDCVIKLEQCAWNLPLKHTSTSSDGVCGVSGGTSAVVQGSGCYIMYSSRANAITF
jgi:hypothetical protein